MGALHAFRTVADDEQPFYDGKPTGKKRHLTIIDDTIVDHVIEQCGFTAAGVYTLMERRANKDGICRNVSYALLAERGGISRRQAIRLVQQLDQAGFVVVRSVTQNGRHVENEFFLPGHLSGPASGDMPSGNNDLVVTSSGDTSGDMTPVGGDIGGDTLKKNSNHVSSPSNQERESDGDSANDPPVAKPYDLLAALCDEQGQDVTVLGDREKSLQLAVAKRLIAGGADEAQVRRIVRWLRPQPWVTSGVDLLLVEKQIGKWRLKGMPDAVDLSPKSGGRKSMNIRDYSPAEWSALAYGPATTPEERELSRQATERLMG